MALNFPNSPTLNQIYTAGNRSWQWNGRFWQSISVTVGYTGSRGLASIFKSSVPTEQDLPIPYGGDEGDGFLVESTGFMWIWDGSSWGSLGRFTGFTGSQGAPGSSVKIIGSVPTAQDLPTDGTTDGSTLLLPGDGFIVQDTGDLYLWTGSEWTNIGRITGDAGPAGFTGSEGFTGSVGFVGSQGESSFTWGPTPPQNPLVGDRWYDTSELILLVYLDDGDSLQWVEVNAAGFQGQSGYTGSAGLSGVLVQSISYSGQATAADTQGGETLGIVGAGFNSGITVYIDSTECSTTLVDSSNLTFVSPAKSAGVYDIVVYNTDGSSGTRPQGIEYSGAPVWTTQPSLPEQTTDSAISIILSATSNSSVTYFLQQGSSMPAGLSLSSSGVITGTVTGIEEDTAYTFTVVAIDAESQTTPRTFSLTVLSGVAVEYLVVAGGGGGGASAPVSNQQGAAGGGAGGYRTSTLSGLSRETSYTITVGAGGAAQSTNGNAGNNGSNSVFSSITSNGGGGGGTGTNTGKNGGSGGGSARSTLGAGSGNTPSTNPSQGNNGGQGSEASNVNAGAGGGGAGAVGGNSSSYNIGGIGGIGSTSSITGASIYYSGGGGGAVASGGSGASGGLGGGGTGGGPTLGAVSGTANTGGGGGGGGNTVRTGAAGGSGVVILKYSNSFTLVNADGGLTFTTSTEVAGYKITTFTAGTGNIVFYRNSDVIEVEYLVVAGGGGGGDNAAGGGGAGGFRTDTLSLPFATSIVVTVGAGGNGGSGNGSGNQGSNSIFNTITSTGGGAGVHGNAGGAGGSGGGAGYGTWPGGASVSPSQGNIGGSTTGTGSPYYAGAGGGGAGAPGASITSTYSGGAGGNGANSSITGSVVTYAGGGAGAPQVTGGPVSGGTGGGGSVASGSAAPESGVPNTGGGGAAAPDQAPAPGGSGGSGVVIIAYPDSHPAITTISAGLVYDQPTRAGYRVYRFTAGTGNVTF